MGNDANFLICVYAGFYRVLAAPLTRLTFQKTENTSRRESASRALFKLWKML